MDDQTIFTPYDKAMQTKELQILKTMIPYVNPNIAHQLSLIIQILQLKNASNYDLAISEVNPNNNNTVEMLSAIKQFCSPKEQETIDTMLNILCIMDNYETILG